MLRAFRTFLVGLFALSLGACAGLQGRDPVQVTVAALEPLPSEGFEIRMMVRLRVQNPNETPIEYDGVYLRLDVLDKTFATGVSDARGTVPRFGETVIGVPVTVSLLRMLRHAPGLLDGQPVDKVAYSLSGKLGGAGFSSMRFESKGEIPFPAAPGRTNQH